ncbi:MAG: proline--tRNA ligase [Candidatus Adiutrix intracellularis]|nr:MAG: proline--tRNA ligase [Candidatus Adiutrix intracellularis]MDR2826519.1 proline--tRNA ligase [Candidatus Adiutrix intracellularis]
MRLSRSFAPTLKEDPTEAEVISHKLLIRAGFIRKLSAGIYSLLPFGLRSLRKLERIIRQEMDRAGALELLLPTVQPGELWKESGRWKYYGKELLRFHDRHNRDYIIGPTHEEVITDLARREIHSWRDLPMNLYQIQTKFRDEIRPRFGLMRGREFIMKDAYSFDADEAGAEQSYRAMYEAYNLIFQNCGLKFAVVEADSGAIGGSSSHEFMVLAKTGEDNLIFCDCGFAANQEKAELKDYATLAPEEMNQALEKIYTPNCHHVPELAALLDIPTGRIIKTLAFNAAGNPLLTLIPGDRKINLTKLKNACNGAEPRLLTPEETEKITGAPLGFIGPIKTKLRVLADLGVKRLDGGVIGAGEADWHYRHARPDRDFKVNQWLDLAIAENGDPCPRCGQPLSTQRGIEVGHIFKLGAKYSHALGALYSRADGLEAPLIMGCYGIGLGRTLAAAVEQNHDHNGIIWPLPLAPYEAAVLPLQVQNKNMTSAAETLFQELLNARVETVLDDRDERPGLKFKDADLIGYPFRITISEKSLALGQVELKRRNTQEITMLPLTSAAAVITQLRNETGITA